MYKIKGKPKHEKKNFFLIIKLTAAVPIAATSNTNLKRINKKKFIY
jgi:hypothetical protein